MVTVLFFWAFGIFYMVHTKTNDMYWMGDIIRNKANVKYF
jgi:hypothetical protein